MWKGVFMFLDPRLFHSSATSEWSSKRMEFHFHLTRIAAWNGIIPLTPVEIATEMGCTVDAVRRYIVQAKDDHILEVSPAGQLRLLKFIEIAKEGEKQDHYVRHFPFFYSKNFQSLSVAAKRFLLHCIANGAYWKATGYERKLKDLYHGFHRARGGKEVYKRGLFNVYQRKHMLEIIDEVSPYLDITIRNEGEQKEVMRVMARPQHFPNDKHVMVANCGKHLWVKKKLDKHGYILSSVQKKAISNLVAIMDDYVSLLSFEDAAVLFEETISQLADSISFLDAMSREEKEQDVYRIFYSLMKQNEESYVHQLSIQYDMLQDTTGAKEKTYAEGKFVIKQRLLVLQEKLSMFKKHWKKRFETVNDPFYKMVHESYHNLLKKSYLFMHMKDIFNEHLSRAREIEQCKKLLHKYEPFSYNWLEAEQ